MPDLHGWITQQIDRREDLARRAAQYGRPDWPQPATAVVDVGDSWPITTEAGPIAEHISTHDPAAVLRRCEADRRILARHRLNPHAYWAEAAMCDGCGTEGEMAYPVTENLNDCPELLDLGYAHGLTDEILASLDRPQDGERPARGPGMRIPDVFAQSFASFLAGLRPVEPRPEVKALEILGPELKKIPGYVPVAKDEP
jgi:hypothetical protein